MPRRTLLGMETEYALSGVMRGGARMHQGYLVERLFAAARSYPRLGDGSGNGFYLANGGRLYVDRGDHPEYATPECEDPWEAVRQVRAGEALLQDLAARVVAEDGEIQEVNLYRCNVDYRRTGATWGCHESYLHRVPPAQLPGELIPHLVSRVCYTGAGGFHPLSPGLEFTRSPRAWMFNAAISGDSTGNRGIYHAKNESLSGAGWHRLHVICGESLCSDTALLLKLGATSLVLAAVEEGFVPVTDLTLAAPVAALQTVAAGRDRTRGLQLADGSRLSAAEIQREYLDAVERCVRAGRLPVWAAALCRVWRRQLDAIESDAPSLAHTLDWALKHSLYQRWAGERFSWSRIGECTEALGCLEHELCKLLKQDLPVTLEAVLEEQAFRKELQRLEPIAAAWCLHWSDLRAFLELRRQMFEIDMRFGQLGRGIFDQLDRRGLVRHRLGDPGPRHPVPGPPPPGRARVRGEWIGRLWAAGDWARYRCEWSQVRDALTGRMLDLSDPFVERAEWQRGPSSGVSASA